MSWRRSSGTGEDRAAMSSRSRWLLPVVSVLIAGGGAVGVTITAKTFEAAVVRLEVGAVVVIALGIALGSERLVALSIAPAVVGLVVGAVGTTTIVWARSLLVGCLWFMAVETALASIEWSGGLRLSAAVVHRRVMEVATVVATGVVVGAVGFLTAATAPQRTLVVRVLLLGAVLAGLVSGLRHLVDSTRPPDDEADPVTVV